MKHLRTPLALAALLAALAAHAQAPAGNPPPMPLHGASGMPGPGGMHGAMRDPARLQQRHEQRLATLKQSLQLAPAQEGAWNEFASAMRPPQNPPARPDRDALAQLTTPERIERMKTVRQQRQAEMDRRAQATLAFYGALNADQKKRFDEQTARAFMGHRGEGHGPGHHHGGHHHPRG
ncbi:Spy/CpxP family protein refolding chaperone [Ramlibacter sp. MAHUQ-53]|uniref:Spy/CpxP family protein refolding chaperone n=1 Tax=unclassified Ramlibacter TaxID=2617605 RepID=UPI0036279858